MVGYEGPDIEDLPEGLGSRFKAAMEKAEPSLELLLEKRENGQWEFNDYSEVYVFDFGILREAYFNVDGDVYKLSIRGVVYEIKRFSKAFGLNVERVFCIPQDFENTKMRIGKEELEIIPGLGHSVETREKDLINYYKTLTGPYMGRR